MDLAYQTPDYGPLTTSPNGSSKKQKKKTVYPTLEIKGEGAIKFLKANSRLKLGDIIDGPAKLKVVGMKREDKDGGEVSEYNNCVTLEVHSIGGGEETMDDEDMPKD